MDGKMDNGGVFHSLAEACGRNRSTKKEGFDFDLENFVSPKRERVKVRREVWAGEIWAFHDLEVVNIKMVGSEKAFTVANLSERYRDWWFEINDLKIDAGEEQGTPEDLGKGRALMSSSSPPPLHSLGALICTGDYSHQRLNVFLASAASPAGSHQQRPLTWRWVFYLHMNLFLLAYLATAAYLSLLRSGQNFSKAFLSYFLQPLPSGATGFLSLANHSSYGLSQHKISCIVITALPSCLFQQMQTIWGRIFTFIIAK